MKKKILFIIPNLKSGGAEKSLVTLLQLFDYDRYDVSLFLFRKEGLFLGCVPPQVRIFTAGENHELFDGDAKTAIKAFIKKGRLNLAAARVLYAHSLKEKDSHQRETKLWKHFRKSVCIPDEKFDCVIGYLEGPSDWLAAEMKADKKIGYMHSYLDNTSSDKKRFKENIEAFDSFVAVSQKCLKNLKNLVPEYNGFIEINNIISPTFILNEAKREWVTPDGKIKILTVGRISHEKGIDVAVDACSALKNKGYPVKWYHIGTGDNYNDIKKQIKKNETEKDFVLLGEKANPYPYINACDIYVQPSRYEGKSIAVDEAKCLHKPIVVTNFPSVYDQISHGINGLICDMNPQAVADAVEKLINDKALRDKLSYNLSQEKIGNEEEIQKLYDLIES